MKKPMNRLEPAAILGSILSTRISAGRRILPRISPTAPPRSPNSKSYPTLQDDAVRREVALRALKVRAEHVRPAGPPPVADHYQELDALPQHQRARGRQQKALGYQVARESSNERARECRNPHDDHDSLSTRPSRKWRIAPLSDARLDTRMLVPPATGVGIPIRSMGGETHGAERKAHESAQYAHHERYSGQDSHLPVREAVFHSHEGHFLLSFCSNASRISAISAAVEGCRP